MKKIFFTLFPLLITLTYSQTEKERVFHHSYTWENANKITPDFPVWEDGSMTFDVKGKKWKAKVKNLENITCNLLDADGFLIEEISIYSSSKGDYYGVLTDSTTEIAKSTCRAKIIDKLKDWFEIKNMRLNFKYILTINYAPETRSNFLMLKGKKCKDSKMAFVKKDDMSVKCVSIDSLSNWKSSRRYSRDYYDTIILEVETIKEILFIEQLEKLRIETEESGW